MRIGEDRDARDDRLAPEDRETLALPEDRLDLASLDARDGGVDPDAAFRVVLGTRDRAVEEAAAELVEAWQRGEEPCADGDLGTLFTALGDALADDESEGVDSTTLAAALSEEVEAWWTDADDDEDHPAPTRETLDDERWGRLDRWRVALRAGARVALVNTTRSDGLERGTAVIEFGAAVATIAEPGALAVALAAGLAGVTVRGVRAWRGPTDRFRDDASLVADPASHPFATVEQWRRAASTVPQTRPIERGTVGAASESEPEELSRSGAFAVTVGFLFVCAILWVVGVIAWRLVSGAIGNPRPFLLVASVLFALHAFRRLWARRVVIGSILVLEGEPVDAAARRVWRERGDAEEARANESE